MVKTIFKNDSEYDKINYFQENGYVIFRNLIPLDVIDDFWNEFEINLGPRCDHFGLLVGSCCAHFEILFCDCSMLLGVSRETAGGRWAFGVTQKPSWQTLWAGSGSQEAFPKANYPSKAP